MRDIWDLRDIEQDAFWVVFANAEEVWDPNGSDGLKMAPAPEGMVGWLQANPHMKTEKPKPTSVGSEKGVHFDAIVSGAAESPECPGCVDLPLFHISSGETTSVEQGKKVRFIVLEDVKGQTVTIFVEASVLGFEEPLRPGATGHGHAGAHRRSPNRRFGGRRPDRGHRGRLRVAGYRDHPRVLLGALTRHLANRQGVQSIRVGFHLYRPR
jgi:hypothetical protein